jgi:hypothetical protein
LPAFIPAPDGTDILFTVTTLIVVGAVLGVGVLFFRLHTLPERVAHKSQKIQFEIVAVLGLLALFTHIHAFWVAGLLLAFIDLPDFGSPLRQMAGSLDRIAEAAGQRGDETPTPAAVTTKEGGQIASDSATSASDNATKKDGETVAVAGKDGGEVPSGGTRTELRAEA